MTAPSPLLVVALIGCVLAAGVSALFGELHLVVLFAALSCLLFVVLVLSRQYRPAELEPLASPNDGARWICDQCKTSNAFDDAKTCTGCGWVAR